MSITFKQGSDQMLVLAPVEFKRIYTRAYAGNSSGTLEYSHSECVVKLANDSRANVEVAQEILPAGNYTNILRVTPTPVCAYTYIHVEGTCINNVCI